MTTYLLMVGARRINNRDGRHIGRAGSPMSALNCSLGTSSRLVTDACAGCAVACGYGAVLYYHIL